MTGTPASDDDAGRLPTAAELRVLEVLWRLGPSTVRAVHEELSRKKPIQYTTALKLLQTMYSKGFVDKSADARAHVYVAAMNGTLTRQSMLRDFVDRVFGGSPQALVVGLLIQGTISEAELTELKELILASSSEVD